MLGSRRRRVGILALGLGATAVVWVGFNSWRTDPTTPSSSGRSVRVDLASGWSEFPLTTGRFGALVVDTAPGLLVWSGWDDEFEAGFPSPDGFAFDEDVGALRPLPPADLCDPSPRTAVWTGDTVVTWSLSSGIDCHMAAGYSPERNTWQPLDAALFEDIGVDVVVVGDAVVDWRQGSAVKLGDRTATRIAPFPGLAAPAVGEQDAEAFWTGHKSATAWCADLYLGWPMASSSNCSRSWPTSWMFRSTGR